MGDRVPGQSGLPFGLKLAADAEVVQSNTCYPWSCSAIRRRQTIGAHSNWEILKWEIHNSEIVVGYQRWRLA
jgi:hypothetical protein